MPTFAFSNSGKFWKTRYSFEPDTYGISENNFVSFLPTTSSDGLSKNACWIHNVNPQRNNFYGNQDISTLTVVSNNDPSMEKQFRSVSIESNQNQFFCSVSTNLDLVEHSVTKPQSSSVKSLVPREEGLYTDIGPSVINSTKHVKFIGKLTSIVGNVGTIQQLVNMIIPPSKQRVGDNYRIFSASLFGESANGNEDSTIKIAFMDEDEQTFFIKNSNNLATPTPFNAQDCYNESAYYIAAIKSNVNSSLPGTYVVIGGPSYVSQDEWTQGPLIKLPGVSVNPSNNHVYIYSVSDPQLNGDSVRGKYAVVTVQSKQNGQPFEIYAINTEYSHSKLDASS
jgi:hypothetical protein